MKEIWKPVVGFEGLYEVSNIGQVRKVCDKVIMKQYYNHDGYKLTTLRKVKASFQVRVHRLVAFAFCEGYKPGLVVNHKNEIKDDNRAENLEWCTVSYNVTYHDSNLKGRNKASTLPRCDEKRKNLGDTLRMIRINKGMSLVDAASKAGICYGTFYQIERGKVTCSFDLLECIARVYGYTLALQPLEDLPKNSTE